MMFIEIDNAIINVNEITSVATENSKYDKNICIKTVLTLSNGTRIDCDAEYYSKIHNIVKPIKLRKDDEARIY